MKVVFGGQTFSNFIEGVKSAENSLDTGNLFMESLCREVLAVRSSF